MGVIGVLPFGGVVVSKRAELWWVLYTERSGMGRADLRGIAS